MSHTDDGASASQQLSERLRFLESGMARTDDQIVVSELPRAPGEEARVVYANDAFMRASGFTLDDVARQGMSILRDDTANAAAEQQIGDALARGESTRVEMVARRKDGSSYWVDLEATPIFDDHGTVSHVLTISRDITERRQTEARLRTFAALLDAARDAIYVMELDGRVRYWNRGAEKLYGWAEREVVGRDVRDVLLPERRRFEAARDQLAETREWAGGMEHLARDGERVDVECRWTLVDGEPSDAPSVLVIESDVTERRLLEARMLRGQRMESLGTLAGGMAHDLNNMLAPVLMSVELLRARGASAESGEVLDTIETASRRGAELIQRVLAYARGVSGERLPLDPRQVVRDVTGLLVEVLPRSIAVDIDMPEPCGAIIGDATQLHQVVLNLCVNARDAMPKGGTLSIALRQVTLPARALPPDPTARPGHFAVLTVRDTGTGMTPAVLARVFDPFFTTKPLGQGTGLGLATTQSIVRSHGGWVTAESELGAGSTFSVFLPLAHVITTPAAAPTRTRGPQGHGELVLVVDDEAAIRRTVRQLLTSAGYRVLEAPDGVEAMLLFRAHHDDIAVVLTDMMMPVMGGQATIEALQAERADVRIIASSGLAPAPEPSAGATTKRPFLQKPYSADELLAALRAVLD